MKSTRIRAFVSAVVAGPAAALISFGLLSMIAPAVAHAQPLVEFAVSLPESSIEFRDLSGNPLGEGLHGGSVSCDGTYCVQATVIQYDPCQILTDPYCTVGNVTTDPEIVYRFMTRQSLDPVNERVVVGGTGTTISRNGGTVAFSFVATFQNNQDGTVSVTYVASRPDASFVIPRAPGTIAIVRRQ